MKKIFKIFATVSLVLSLIPTVEVFAMDNSVDKDISLEEILSKEATAEEVNRVGQEIADEMNNASSKTRTSGELWTLTGSTRLYSRRAIKGKYKTHVDSNTNETYSVTVSLAATFTYKPTSSTQISVTGGISTTKSKTFKGPSNEYLSNGNLATHRLFIGLTFGEIYQYTFRVTDKYSGRYLRTETTRGVVGDETFGLNQLMRVNSNGSITVGNIDNNSVKTYSSISAYKSALEAYSYTCKDVIYFQRDLRGVSYEKKITFFSIIIVCIVSISLVFFTKKYDPYSPIIRNIDSFIIEDDTRYIILYNSEENCYYLGTVTHYALDNNLYYLGDTVCNFKEVDHDLIVISNSNQVIYSSGNYDLLPDDVYDIKSLGLLMITYDVKSHDMQILKRNSEATCILKFKYYYDFIPVDLIETQAIK